VPELTDLETAAAIAAICGAVLTLAAFVAAVISSNHAKNAAEAAEHATELARDSALVNARERSRERLIWTLRELAAFVDPAPGYSPSAIADRHRSIRLRLMPLTIPAADLPECHAIAFAVDEAGVVSGKAPTSEAITGAAREAIGALTRLTDGDLPAG
jgi:hypothetical protein